MKIICFAGSTRKDSLNKALAKIIVQHLATRPGIEAQFIDLANYPLPLYDGDLEAEQGLPENALKLKKIFQSADAFVIACPEYNSSITPLLKNTLDWVSRSASKDEKPLSAYTKKKAALVATSPGALGGLRGLVTVRSILGNIGVWVSPTQLAIPKGHEVIVNGQIKDDQTTQSIQRLINDLIDSL